MQTFLPYPSFSKSARVLDRQRLGKQRVETLQIMKTLLVGGGWSNHPAVRMWRGHELALLEYQDFVVQEWVSRGYNDTCFMKTSELVHDFGPLSQASSELPDWFGNRAFHRAHKSNLLRKDPEYYGSVFRNVPEDLPYVWPA